LLSSSLYCKLCTLRQYSILFLSARQPHQVAVLRNMCNFVQSQLLYFIKLLVTHCSPSFLVDFGIDNYVNNREDLTLRLWKVVYTMCIRLTLLLLLQGELHWTWLENLKVYYELSKFGYYKIRNNWSTIHFPNYLFSKLFVKQSWRWCSYKTKRLVYCYKVRAFLLLYLLFVIIHNTLSNIFYNLFEGIDISLTQQLRCPWVSDKVEWYFDYQLFINLLLRKK